MLDLWVPKTRTLFVKIETRDSCCIKLIYCKIGKLSDVKNVLVFMKFNMNSRSLGTFFCGKFNLKIKIKINIIKTIHINISIFSPSAVISLASNKWKHHCYLGWRCLSDYNHRNKTIWNFPNTLCHHVRGRHVLYYPYPGEDNWRNILLWKEGIIHEERHNNENI